MAHINKNATAAVGIVFSLMAIIQAIGFFFGHGSSNYMSRELDRRNVENAEKMAAVGFFTSFLCGLALLTGCLLSAVKAWQAWRRSFGLLGLELCQPIADLFTFLLALPLGCRTQNTGRHAFC